MERDEDKVSCDQRLYVRIQIYRGVIVWAADKARGFPKDMNLRGLN